jgi:2'-hydroxyisoflavone reductase
VRILILGGTRFVGRAITEAALGRGDKVTLFNRGKTSPGLYPGVETVTGDRATDLARLEGRQWDAVVDVAGYDPEIVRISAEAFGKTAGRSCTPTRAVAPASLRARPSSDCSTA